MRQHVCELTCCATQLSNVDDKKQDTLFEATRDRLSQWAGKTVFIRNLTVNAAPLVPDGLDFAYVDARHDYCGVRGRCIASVCAFTFFTGLVLCVSLHEQYLGYSASALVLPGHATSCVLHCAEGLLPQGGRLPCINRLDNVNVGSATACTH
jgi:hypothetical protein